MGGGSDQGAGVPEPGAGAGAGVVELRDGVHAVVRVPHGGPVPGAAGAGLPRDPAVPARVVLRCRGQMRAGPAGGGGDRVLRAAAGLGAAALVGHAAGAGAGRHPCAGTRPGLALRGAHGERGVPRLRHPGGLEGARGGGAAGLATGVAGAAAHARAGGAARLGGGRARRPRPLRRVPAHGCVVPPDRAAGLASLPAHQPRRHLPPGRAEPAPPPDGAGAPRRRQLGGARRRLPGSRGAPALHPPRRVPPGCGPRPQGPLAGAHRPGPPGLLGRLVRRPHLDRAGV